MWHSQLRDVLGDAPGQGLEVLVAAADHGVEAGALLRALGPRDAACLLLTCTGQGGATMSPGHGVASCSHPVRLGSVPYTFSTRAHHLPSPQSKGAAPGCTQSCSCTQTATPPGWVQTDSSRLSQFLPFSSKIAVTETAERRASSSPRTAVHYLTPPGKAQDATLQAATSWRRTIRL